MVALRTFDALAVGVADVRLLADACGNAAAFQAFLGHLRSTVDHERQRGVAAGQAVQLGAALVEEFAVAGALILILHGRLEQGDVDWSSRIGFLGDAVGGLDADAQIVSQVSFLAEASDDAVLGADRAGMRVSAGRRAGRTARAEDFVFVAFGDWWQHHEVGRRNRVDLRALFGHDAASVAFGADVSFLAGATGDADTRADGVGFFAGAVAALALTEFFVITAHLRWHRDGLGSWNAAGFRRHAHAVFVFQVAGFAEATDDALQRAHLGGMGFGAGRRAGRAARHEDLIFFALRDFRRVGEEHGGLRGLALLARHAKAVRVSQMSLFAEASDDAVLGADRARVGIGAGRGASGAARIEFFI